ncbi:phosphodiesterase [Metapseudomonas lalkuanensis]|uniref:Phosphodiesterase n=1 Tax=Metapseudomonas lalkuanensis TaxID=2604832 RepID=A0A5J6QII4_9GAMM|nr:phosphodiesterase [Pseudomonas lalkuanensis]QEY62374.1 phosphodiesterase [Pseudomonas lalkuanensis]UCP00238.1 phosphodiesterase [Pseudomonas lalkuanensis]
MTRPGLLLTCLLLTLPAGAQTIEIPVGDQGDQALSLPARGESQHAVLERFGLPDEEHPAVGKPPISRWDYREFSVYFESGRVIDSVRHHQPRAPRE